MAPEYASADPMPSVAVTTTRKLAPWSPERSVYVEAVAMRVAGARRPSGWVTAAARATVTAPSQTSRPAPARSVR
jgi:hypothetical protein